MGRFHIERMRIVAAPVDDVWAVVGDVGRYAAVVDSLRHTEVTSGDGLGMVRHCVDVRGREWDETCTRWDEGRLVQMTVDIETYPRSFRAILRELEGTWSVEPTSSGTMIRMQFDGVAKLGPVGRAAVGVMGKPAVLDRIIDGYEREVARRRQSKDSTPQ